jgi:hypothetical protein
MATMVKRSVLDSTYLVQDRAENDEVLSGKMGKSNRSGSLRDTGYLSIVNGTFGR